jgi:hypothetical protein
MVAFNTVVREKRIRFSDLDALAVAQCIDNALDALEVPKGIALHLAEIGNRLCKAFDLTRCPECDCVCVAGEECEGRDY